MDLVHLAVTLVGIGHFYHIIIDKDCTISIASEFSRGYRHHAAMLEDSIIVLAMLTVLFSKVTTSPTIHGHTVASLSLRRNTSFLS